MTTRIAARPAAPPALSGEPLRVAVLGATGYVGAELVRILERHPHVRIVALAARKREGVPPGAGAVDAISPAPPHGQAATIAPPLLERGVLVVDLGPDFRLSDPADYPTWYGFEHPAPELLPGGPGRPGDTAIAAAIYGLPELHREALARTRLVASPGCYPTAALLALAPLARAGLVQDVVVDAKSGVSGAGREPKLETPFGGVNEAVRAYGLGGHRPP